VEATSSNLAGQAFAREESEPSETTTLAATLRAFYAEKARTDSVAQLADRFANGDKRQVERAHALIRLTYGARFVEEPRWDGRVQLAPLRYLLKPGGPGRLGFFPLDQGGISSSVGEFDQQSRSRVRADFAPCSNSTSAPDVPSRRPARKLDLPRPAVDPIRLEDGVSEALRQRHGAKGWWQVLQVLREPLCAQHEAEAMRAARTLAERDARVPGAVFRSLFARALAGDPLVDQDQEVRRTREVERAAIADNPDLSEDYAEWTQLTGEKPVAPGPEPPRSASAWARQKLAELEAERQEREARAQEAADRAALEALAERMEALERGPP
jgi:hypothetical protein